MIHPRKSLNICSFVPKYSLSRFQIPPKACEPLLYVAYIHTINWLGTSVLCEYKCYQMKSIFIGCTNDDCF